MPDADLIVVQTFTTGVEANIAKGALEAEGIDALIQSDSAGGMRPHLAWAGSGYRVMVRAEDEDAARRVLEPASDSD